jgi:hypothetical protein
MQLVRVMVLLIVMHQIHNLHVKTHIDKLPRRYDVHGTVQLAELMVLLVMHHKEAHAEPISIVILDLHV